ncbi:MAG: hypothetical protein HGB05_03885 [Chloroflexi bacterium]|nr:hypothetical protein [Chloroflexota bacterium]
MDERLEQLFAFYALGVLTDEERAQVDAYVATEPGARARLDETLRAATVLPYAPAPIQPHVAVKQSLMKRVQADARIRLAPPQQSFADKLSQLLIRPSFKIALPVLAAACLVIAVLFGVWGITLNNEVTRLRTAAAALQRDLVASRETLAQVIAPNVRAIAITGTPVQPEAHGKLIADPGGNSALLVTSDLKPLPPEQVYQFWLIRGDVPVSGGLFTVDTGGRGILRVESDEAVESFDAIGVSIEPVGGSPQPTGPIVMLGKLSES